LYLKALMLRNYRNYSELKQSFNPGLNIISGENAQGKTNLIESIYCLSFGRSFKTRRDSELIKWGQNSCLIKSAVCKLHGELSIEAQFAQNQKTFKINGLEHKRLRDFMGNFNVVIFSPEELKLVKGGPWERRKFMDNEISQMNANYRHNLLNYFKVLNQRNAFLKSLSSKRFSESQLDVWNRQLAEFGSKVVIKRMDFIEKLSVLAKLMQRKLTGGCENIELKYVTTLGLKIFGKDIEKTYDVFLERLSESESEDIYRKVTTVGPHRDDIMITMNGTDLRTYGSQGQQRTCVLSLHMAEMELIKAETGEYPVLLLDDVFSELDERRRFNLLETVSKAQTFITTTQQVDLQNLKGCSDSMAFVVKNGSVIERDGRLCKA
jgi:DNA replication and repair protein RecF